MATIIHRHLTKRLLFACLLVLVGLVAPLIVISLFGHLPPALKEVKDVGDASS